MRALKWLIGGAALAWIVASVARRADLATRMLPFMVRSRSRADQVFYVEPVETREFPAGAGPSSTAPADDQQHVDASYRREHGHPKR